MVWKKKALSFVFICIMSCLFSMVALASPPVLEGWKLNDTGWWYRKLDGTYLIGSWKNINNKWYYFDDNGYMVKDSWVSNYYVGSDGAMLVSTVTPDGYHVLESGEWVEGSQAEVQNNTMENIQSQNSDQNELGPRVEDSNINKSEEQNLSGNSSPADLDAKNDSVEEENVGPVANESEKDEIGPGADKRNETKENDSELESKSDDGSSKVETDSNESGVGQNTDSNSSNVGYDSDTNSNSVQHPTTVIQNDDNNDRSSIVDELLCCGLSEEEANLYYLINEYRESLGLSRLSFSKSLTKVARAHVKDSHDYTPRLQRDDRGIQGNLHSWSNNGNWRGGAYTPDHEHAEIMWDKPSELTDYKGAGYEISVYHSIGIDPKLALDLWKSSSGHNEVIIGDNDWSFITTMGVAMYKNYSHVWFGGDEDPAGYYDIEGYEVIHP